MPPLAWLWVCLLSVMISMTDAFTSVSWSLRSVLAQSCPLRASLTDRPRSSELASKDETRQLLLSTAGIILPTLSRADKSTLLAGNRVQKQERSERAGYGVVVLDVPVGADTVFDVLTQFERYNEIIPTVRSVRIFSSNEKRTMAEFSLSKFNLKVNVIQAVFREQRVIKFSLDNSRNTNLVLRQADGFWHVQPAADHPGYSRVYLSTNVVVSRLIPSFIVDYAAARALPRATTWLQDLYPEPPVSVSPDTMIIDENESY